MKHIYNLIIAFLFIGLSVNSFGQGATCATADPFCTSTVYAFPNQTNNGSAPAGNNYDCLTTTPNPAWYYMEIGTSGNLIFDITQTDGNGSGLDVDFILYGGYTDLATAQADCGNLGIPAGEVVDCSYSTSASETAVIPGAVAGEVYLILITNFSNDPGTITFQQTGGSGSSDCAIIVPPCPTVGIHAEDAGGNSYAFPITLGCDIPGWVTIREDDLATAGGIIAPAVVVDIAPTNNNAGGNNIYGWENNINPAGWNNYWGVQNIPANTNYTFTMLEVDNGPNSTSIAIELCNDFGDVDMPYTITDAACGGVIASGTWNAVAGGQAGPNGFPASGGCQFITIPVGSVGGSAVYSCPTCPPGSFQVTDFGRAWFNPSVAGPGSYDITYCFDNGCAPPNDCQDCDTETIVVENSYPTTSLSYTTPVCSTNGNLSPTLTGTTGGDYSSTAGLSINSTTGVINVGASTPGSYTVTYFVGTALPSTCNSTVSAPVVINATPTVTVPASATYCPGDAVPLGTLASVPAGGTFSWANSNTAIGLGGSGTGNVPAFTATNATGAAISGTITVTPTLNGCVGTPSNYTITINPTPTVTVPASATYCPGDAVPLGTLASVPAGGTFSWANSNTAIGLGGSGTGNVPAFTATNATGAAISGTITVTPTLNGCVGTPSNYTITINPTPTVTVPASATYCPGDAVPLGTLASVPAGGTFSWANSNTAIGLGGSGTGNVPAFTATNATGAAISGTITVTPTLNGCVGTPSNYTITINPTPTVSPISPSECENISGSGQALNIDVTGLEAGLNGVGTFVWFDDNTYTTPSAPQPTNVTVNNGQTFYFEVTINGCTLQDSITYTVSGNIVLNDPMPEFCEDVAGGGSVLIPTLTAFNNSVFAGATTYNWATGPLNVTVNDGDSINVQVTQGTCPTVSIYVHFIVHPLPTANQTTMNMCDDGTGQATFDLTTLNGTVDGGAGNTVVWYTNSTLGTAIVPDNAFLTGSTTVYAEVTNLTTTCTDTASITLIVDPLPTANQTTMNVCDDGTGQATFDLTTLNGTVDGGAGNTVVWYTNSTLGTAIVPDNAYLTGSTTVYAQVSDGTCTDTASVTLIVDPLPTANQTTMNMCDDGTGQATFDLTTLNGTVDGGAGNTVVWYTNSTLGTAIVPDNAFLTGSTVVYAQVTNATTTCTDTASIILTVDPLPAAIDQTPSLCEDVLGGGSASGVDLTSLNSSVDGGAGNSLSWFTNQPLTIPVVTPTNVTVNNGDVFYVLVDNGTCTDTAMVTYTVTSTITLVNPNDSLCEDVAGGGSVAGVDLTSYNATIYTGAGVFTWFDDAAMGVTDSILMPTLTNYTIISGTADTFYVDVVDGNCNNTIMVVFTVNPLPSATQASMILCDDGTGQATFDLTTLNNAVGGTNGVVWYTDGTLGTAIVPDNAYLTSSTTVYAQVTDAVTGCTDTASTALTVNPLPTTVSVPMNLCDDGTGQATFDLTSNSSAINGGGTDSVLWFANVVDIPATPINPANAYLTVSTTVYAQITDTATGCSDTVSIALIVNPQSMITMVPDTSVCLNDPLDITATGNGSGTITWYADAAGAIVLQTGNPFTPPTGATGSITYYVNEDGTCPSAMDTFIVTIGGVVANINANPLTGAVPLDVSLDGTGSTGIITSYNWDFGDGNTDTQSITNNIYSTIGEFTVTLIVTDGVCSDTTTIIIDAFGESAILIPNVFTPNGDGSNDIFTVEGVNLESVEGEIYNRWGQLMFSWNNIKGHWDGRTLAGSEAPDGTYFYIITAIGVDGTEYFEKGGFSLIR